MSRRQSSEPLGPNAEQHTDSPAQGLAADHPIGRHPRDLAGPVLVDSHPKRAANNWNARIRLKQENDRLRQEVALLIEEMRIKDARMLQVTAQRMGHVPVGDSSV